MAKHYCPNITSDQTNYSAPVPFIGLYIATATMVCFLLILCDVINGIRRRKIWIPCHFFPLNSVTLTLIAIAAKLPVDLTTPMPSAYDQLSKLTGTALLTVSMGFFVPSLGINSGTESWTNLAALTIFVVTIVVNICIQMSTGVIFSFIVEHVIVMFCMLWMLILFWYFIWDINIHKEVQIDRRKNLFANGIGSMLGRLKLCYLHSYGFEPQFVLCKVGDTGYAGIPCLLCLIVVLQGTFRSLVSHELRFCNEFSDYGWSIRIIIVAQILVIILVNLPLGFRWHVTTNNDEDLYFSTEENTFKVIRSSAPLLKAEKEDYFVAHLRIAIDYVYICMTFVFGPLMVGLALLYENVVKKINSCRIKHGEDSKQEYTEILDKNGIVLTEWTLRKCVCDIKRWIKVSQESNSLSHLRGLLSERPPSHQSLEQLHTQYNFEQGRGVSCLYLVFLERIASVSTPPSIHGGRLRGTLSEVFDMIYFVDTKLNSMESNNKQKCMLGKAMWMGEDFERPMNRSSQSQSKVSRVLKIIRKVKDVLPALVWNHVAFIIDYINGREYTSVEELYNYMEQLFVDMLHIFLSQLPCAIFKEVIESPAEEYEEKVRGMLRIMCQIESLEGNIQWCFPAGSNITSLVTTEAANHLNTGLINDGAANNHVLEDEDLNVRSPHCEIQVD